MSIRRSCSVSHKVWTDVSSTKPHGRGKKSFTIVRWRSDSFYRRCYASLNSSISAALIRQQFRKNPHNTLASYHEGTMRIHTRPQEILNVHPSWRSRLSQDTLSAQLHIQVWNGEPIFFILFYVYQPFAGDGGSSRREDTEMWDVGAAGGMRYWCQRARMNENSAEG